MTCLRPEAGCSRLPSHCIDFAAFRRLSNDGVRCPEQRGSRTPGRDRTPRHTSMKFRDVTAADRNSGKGRCSVSHRPTPEPDGWYARPAAWWKVTEAGSSRRTIRVRSASSSCTGSGLLTNRPKYRHATGPQREPGGRSTRHRDRESRQELPSAPPTNPEAPWPFRAHPRGRCWVLLRPFAELPADLLVEIVETDPTTHRPHHRKRRPRGSNMLNGIDVIKVRIGHCLGKCPMYRRKSRRSTCARWQLLEQPFGVSTHRTTTRWTPDKKSEFFRSRMISWASPTRRPFRASQ